MIATRAFSNSINILRVECLTQVNKEVNLNQTEFISFRVSLGLWQALETYCDRQDVNVSEAIRQSLQALLKTK